MATIVLSAIGSAIGGSLFTSTVGIAIGSAIGSAIGGSIGYQIDAQLFGLNDPQTGEGQRLEEISLSSGQPGTPLVECWGREVRVPGHYIFMGDVIETQRRTKVSDGGKKGPDVFLNEFLYDVDVALAIADARYRKVESAHKIFMNGKKVFDRPLTQGPQFDLFSNFTRNYPFGNKQEFATLEINQGQVRFIKVYFVGFNPDQGEGAAYEGWSREGLVYNDFNNVYNLDIDRSLAVRMNDFSNETNGDYLISIRYDLGDSFPADTVGANNVTGQPFEGQPTGVPYTNYFSPPFVGGGNPHSFRQIPEEELSFAGLADRLTFYDGTQNTADPAIQVFENIENVGNAAPCFKGTCYHFFEGLQLEEFGNGLPRVEFIIDCEGSWLTDADGNDRPYGITVDTVISQILTNAGFQASEFDVSGIDGTREKNGVYGFAIEGTTSTANKLRALMNWYDIGLREKDGKLEFYDNDNPLTGTIASSELQAKEPGSPPREELITTDIADYELVTDVQVQSRNVNDEGQALSVRANNPVAVYLNESELNFKNMTSTQGMATNVARRILDSQQRGARTFTFSLPPSRLDVLEGDLLTINISGGNSFQAIVDRVSRGANFLHEVEATRFDGFYEYTGVLDGGDGDGESEIPVNREAIDTYIGNDVPRRYFNLGEVSEIVGENESRPYALLAWGPSPIVTASESFVTQRCNWFSKIQGLANWVDAFEREANPVRTGSNAAWIIITAPGTNLSEVTEQNVIDPNGTFDFYVTLAPSTTQAGGTPSAIYPQLQSCSEAELRSFGQAASEFAVGAGNTFLIGREIIAVQTINELEADPTPPYNQLRKYRATGLIRNVGSYDRTRMVHSLGSERGIIVEAKGIENRPVGRYALAAKSTLAEMNDQKGSTVQFDVVLNPDGPIGEEIEFQYVQTGENLLPDVIDPETVEALRMTAAFNNTNAFNSLIPANLQVGDLIVSFLPGGTKNGFNSKGISAGCDPLDYLVEIMSSGASNATVKRSIYIRFNTSSDILDNLYPSRPSYDGVLVQGQFLTAGVIASNNELNPGGQDGLDSIGSATHPLFNCKFLYTAAQQTADFGGTQSSVHLRIYTRGKYDEYGKQYLSTYGGFSTAFTQVTV